VNRWSLKWKIILALLISSALGTGCATKPSIFRERDFWSNSLHLTFVRIPAGEFIMGSPPSEPLRFDNETAHPVRISHSFYLAATTVTVGQFAAFVHGTGYQTAAEHQGWANGAWDLRQNKWQRLPGASWRNPGFTQTVNHPVVCVTYHDATAFCDWLSAKEKRKYRLPTEAEWEYACRADQQTAYLWGNNPDAGAGWINGCDQTAKDTFNLFPSFNWSDGYLYTSPVATFKPNAWGLHDMLGNTLEWCSDWYAAYPPGQVTDPSGPATGSEKILRGGAFVYGPKHCRCAFRGRNLPDFENFYTGFRLAME
jgi:sulfatase modifying factor 1